MSSESGKSNHICLGTSWLSTGCQWIPNKTWRTWTNSSMISRLAFSILSTSICAWRSTIVIKASPVQGTLAVIDTFSSWARYKWISSIPSWAGTNRPVGSRPVKSSLALRSRSTRVRSAQILFLKRSATYKWISCIASWTRADSFMVGCFTCCTLTTYVWIWVIARVSTLKFHAGLVGCTVVVSGALSVTASIGIPKEIRRTTALCSMIYSLTISILSTSSSSTSWLTPIILTITALWRTTLLVRIALMTTSLERISYVCWLASTYRPVILTNLTVGICSTWSTNFIASESSAVPEWITSCASWTSTDCYMILYGTVCSLSTR